eukprot:m.112387 g.112387  ORF g.112387 m.112387 type:complete len:87 (+) comp37439_c0_seq3:456-716(+)
MAGLAPNERASRCVLLSHLLKCRVTFYRQRKLLLRRLGLDSATSGMETGSLIEDEDLLPYQLKAVCFITVQSKRVVTTGNLTVNSG